MKSTYILISICIISLLLSGFNIKCEWEPPKIKFPPRGCCETPSGCAENVLEADCSNGYNFYKDTSCSEVSTCTEMICLISNVTAAKEGVTRREYKDGEMGCHKNALWKCDASQNKIIMIENCTEVGKNCDSSSLSCISECGAVSAKDYCSDTSGSDTSYGEYIKRVEFAGINYESGDNGGYLDATSQKALVSMGGKYTIKVTFNTGGYLECAAVWFDWNGDKILEDTEKIEIGCCDTDNCIVSKDIVIPSAISGPTLMRVVGEYDEYPSSPCDIEYNEIEDYTVCIEEGCQSDEDCNPGETCIEGVCCIVECYTDKDCPDDKPVCKNGGTCNAECLPEDIARCEPINCYSCCTNTGPQPGKASNDWISNVQFAGQIDHNSGCDTEDGHENFLDQVAIVERNHQYDINVTVRGSGYHCVSVAIDWDQNGFASTYGRYLLGCCYGDCSVGGVIEVPDAALSGPTMMRVSEETRFVESQKGYAAPCEAPISMQYGEHEDYTICVVGT